MIYEKICGTFADENLNKDMKYAFYEGISQVLLVLEHITEYNRVFKLQDGEWNVFEKDGNGLVFADDQLECLTMYYELFMRGE